MKSNLDDSRHHHFRTSRNLKQRDSLAQTLLNIALESATRQMHVGRKTLLTNKTIELLADYADNINVLESE